MITKSNLLTNFQVCGLEILKQPEGFALPREEGLTGQRYERFTLVGFGRRGGKLIANFRALDSWQPGQPRLIGSVWALPQHFPLPRTPCSGKGDAEKCEVSSRARQEEQTQPWTSSPRSFLTKMPFSKAGAVTFEGHVLAHQDVLMCIAHIVAKQNISN
nr:uncharacterized protein LOC110362310 isoform X1 [Columba livia]